MKGIVFLQFTNMVNELWGEEMTEKLLDQTELDSGGVYTSVGTYCYQEMVGLVTTLSGISGLSVSELQKAFGEYLFAQLSAKYSAFLEGCPDLFSFLETIEDKIHVEVKKLYPEAELPTFTDNRTQENILELVYSSQRPFADLAEGLLKGAIRHYGEDVIIMREDITVDTGAKALFRLTRG